MTRQPPFEPAAVYTPPPEPTATYQRQLRRPYEYPRLPTPIESNEGGVPGLALIGILVLAGLAGFAAGAFTFQSSQVATTQRVTVTSVVTSLQPLTTTNTQLTTATQMTSQASQTVSQTSSQTSVLTSVPGWREIKRFTGSTGNTTEQFSVTTPTWRVRWSYGTSADAQFNFGVYRVGQDFSIEFVAPTGPSGEGTTTIYQGMNNFYLKIAANVPYTIVIEIPASTTI